MASCRFCFEEGEELISPCPCKGSQKWIHESCLLKWYEMKAENHICAVCKYEFVVKPLGSWEYIPPHLSYYVAQPLTNAVFGIVINLFFAICSAVLIPEFAKRHPYRFNAYYQVAYFLCYAAFFWKRYISLIHNKKAYLTYLSADAKQMVLCMSLPLLGLFVVENQLYHFSAIFLAMFSQGPLVYYHYMTLKEVNDNIAIQFVPFSEPASSS